MKNQELKAALVCILSYCTQTVYYRVGGFSLIAASLEDDHSVLLENFVEVGWCL